MITGDWACCCWLLVLFSFICRCGVWWQAVARLQNTGAGRELMMMIQIVTKIKKKSLESVIIIKEMTQVTLLLSSFSHTFTWKFDCKNCKCLF